MATEIRYRPRVVVQTAAAWPGDDTGWQTQRLLIPIQASEGLSQIVGDAQFEQVVAQWMQPGEAVIQPARPLSLLGQYARILVEDADAGEVSVPIAGQPVSFAPLWHGIVTRRNLRQRQKAGVLAGFTAAGIGWVLEQLSLVNAYEFGRASNVLAALFHLPAFNGIRGGDRSVGTVLVGDVTLPVFDRAAVTGLDGDRRVFTALDVAQLLLALIQELIPGGPKWRLTGQTDVLRYSRTWNFAGKSLASCLAQLINPRRGAGYRTVVNDDREVELQVVSLLNDAITVGNITLPAAAQTTEVDLDTVWRQWAIDSRQDYTADRIQVLGPHPLVAISLLIKPDGTGDLVQDWTTQDETDWVDRLKAITYASTDTKTFRRFTLAAGFTGVAQVSTDALRYELTPSALGDPLYGDGGLTGERTTIAAGTDALPNGLTHYPHGATYQLERLLPLYQNHDWTSGLPAVVDTLQPRMSAMVFARQGDLYRDLSGSLHVEIEEETSAVLLGSGETQARLVRGLLAAGWEIVVTVGIREVAPLQVSWQRPQADRPRDQDRVMVLSVATAESFRALAGTVIGVTKINGPVTVGQTIDVLTPAAAATNNDPLSDLRADLALAKAYYGVQDEELDVLDRAIIDRSDDTAPGALVTRATGTLVNGDDPTAFQMAAPITRRTWTFQRRGHGTRVTTERCAPSAEAVL